MSWREDLLAASIGGAPFLVEQITSSFGRRTVSAEFPGRDTPAHEDLGRRARRFSVQAVVVGEEYMAQRDDVVGVLERPGPHTFVHPWAGEFAVILDGSIDVVESQDRGGMARLSFTVVESGDPGEVRITPSPAAAVAAAVAATLDAGVADFERDWNPLAAVFAAAAAAVGAVTGALRSVVRKATSAMGVTDVLTDAINDLEDAIDRLLALPSELAAQLAALVGAVQNLVRVRDAEDVAEFPGGGKAVRTNTALELASDLAALELEEPPPEDFEPPQDPQEAVNSAALVTLVKVASVAEAAGTFAVVPLESADAAKQVLTVLSAQVEALAVAPTTSDDLYVALVDLKAALDKHLAAVALELPSVGTFVPDESVPALVVAYQLYGDPERDAELVARNDVADPNFLPGGVPLQVLLDATG